MGQWDTTSRAITDKWGEKRVTALGMRAVFVGWRASSIAVKLGPSAWCGPCWGRSSLRSRCSSLCRRRTSFAVRGVPVRLRRAPVWSSRRRPDARRRARGAFASVWLLLTRATWVDDQGRHRRRFDFFTEFWARPRSSPPWPCWSSSCSVKASWLRNVRPGDTAARRAVALRPAGGRGGDRHLRHLVLGEAAVAGGDHGAQRRHRRRCGCGSSAKTATDAHEPWQSLQLLGSFWWALIVMILVTTLLGYNVDFADLPEPADA